MTTVSTASTADELFAAYEPGSTSLFASPRGTLLAEGSYLPVPDGRADLRAPDGRADLARRVDAVLDAAVAAGHEVRTVVGAIPFDSGAPARLMVPMRLRRAGAPVFAAGSPSPIARAGALRAVPAVETYAAAVSRAVSEIRAGAYAKVVLARSLRVDAPGFDPAPVVRALAGRDPGGYTFGIGLGGGRTLFGASPELLVSRHGNRVTANPLAGSAARSPDPAEDRRRGEALLRSAKERHEHALVAEAVGDALRPYCTGVSWPTEPALIRTATMWHLSTVVTGTVADPAVSSLVLATALHPTPAVCGTPTATARSAIAALEPFDRGFYTGMVGWTDDTGDGEWAVTIRCAVADADGLDLFSGAGVVADSDPQAELAETTAKFGTMLAALGLGAGESHHVA